MISTYKIVRLPIKSYMQQIFNETSTQQHKTRHKYPPSYSVTKRVYLYDLSSPYKCNDLGAVYKQ